MLLRLMLASAFAVCLGCASAPNSSPAPSPATSAPAASATTVPAEIPAASAAAREEPPPPPPALTVAPAPDGETPYRKQLRITGEQFTQCLQEDAAACEARCKKGDVAACREVGQRFAVGMNAPADPKRAEFYLFEACNTQSDAKACDYLASFYGANAPMAKRDQDKHQKYRQRACELDWAQACYAVGGYHFAFKRMEEAKAAHGKACDLGLTQSCAAIEE